MYLNKVLVDKHSKYILDVLPDETIKKILSLIFNSQKIKKMYKDKNIVRIIKIIKYYCGFKVTEQF